MKRHEQTLVVIKPDAVARKLVGTIISRLEATEGLEIVALKLVRATYQQVRQHFIPSREWLEMVGENVLTVFSSHSKNPEEVYGTKSPRTIGELLRDKIYEHLESGPSVVMVVSGQGSVSKVRNLVGATDPADALPGTIRHDFAQDSIVQSNLAGRALRNVVHSSTSAQEAGMEISAWFSKEEVPNGTA